MYRRLISGSVIGLLCLALLGSAMAGEPRRGGTLRIAYEADITGMDPHTSKDGITRAAAIRAGEVDFVNEIPVEHAERLTEAQNIHVYRGIDASKIYAPFNVQRKPFDDLRVRQALAGYGVSRQAIAKIAFLGFAEPLAGVIPPGTRGHKDILEMYPYDPKRASQLLEAADITANNPLEYRLMTHAAYPPLPNVATIMKTQLESLGPVRRLSLRTRDTSFARTCPPPAPGYCGRLLLVTWTAIGSAAGSVYPCHALR